ncbi:MAG: hypothetical protein K2X47_01100, partial [Bdellovibrionales bacterium]|nr:hypothetical protein [Bdellovibrionales bacterium]
HEASHHLGLGVKSGTDADARKFAERLLPEIVNLANYTATPSNFARKEFAEAPFEISEGTVDLVKPIFRSVRIAKPMNQVVFDFKEVEHGPQGACNGLEILVCYKPYAEELEIVGSSYPKDSTLKMIDWIEQSGLCRKKQLFPQTQLEFDLSLIDHPKVEKRGVSLLVFPRAKNSLCHASYTVLDPSGKSVGVSGEVHFDSASGELRAFGRLPFKR